MNVHIVDGAKSGRGGSDGFSLVELIAAVAIALLLMTLAAPVASDAMKSGARRAAAIELLNMCELARIEAISKARTVYLGFSNADFPIAQDRYRSMILFYRFDPNRAPSPIGSSSSVASKYIPIGKWQTLPEGITIRSQGRSAVNLADGGAGVTIKASDQFPKIDNETVIPAIAWNSTGMITQPAASGLRLYLYEGYHLNGQDNFSRNRDFFENSSSGAMFDEITFARFTGRARLKTNEYQPQ